MDKSLYILAQFDNETQKALHGYYETLVSSGITGTQTKDIPYHFTLGCYPCDMEPRLLEHINAATADLSGVTVRFDHIGLFGLNVLFFAPNVTRELLELRERFMLPGAIDEFTWSPHVTLLIDEPDNILKALPIMVRHLKPLAAHINVIGLYEFFPKRLIKQFILI